MQLKSNGLILDLTYPKVMGILNVTPDSFSDGGAYNTVDAALHHTEKMITAGATMVDIGGESTRPGAAEVSVQQEIDRVVPVIEAIVRHFDCWVSVDTSKPEVIRAAAEAGANLINDIRALQLPGALEAAAQTNLPICLMHRQGEPKDMQDKPNYQDVVAEVDSFLASQIVRCEQAGISKSRLLLDPGFGFGKNLEHNYQLLAHLAHYHHFGLPLLVGMSRKSMIGQLLHCPPTQRVIGSVACAVIAAMQGAQVIRVHDAKETVEAMRIVEATLVAKKDKG